MFRRSSDSPRVSVFPETVTRWAGSIWVSTAAAVWVVGTISLGVATNFPQWWQITVYSAGALISVLMLFLIQHTNNRHTNAILVKLDELIKATSGARNEVIGIEDQQLDEQDELSNELSDAAVLEKGG
jgi:low affinity Fe/Cu permease